MDPILLFYLIGSQIHHLLDFGVNFVNAIVNVLGIDGFLTFWSRRGEGDKVFTSKSFTELMIVIAFGLKAVSALAMALLPKG